MLIQLKQTDDLKKSIVSSNRISAPTTPSIDDTAIKALEKLKAELAEVRNDFSKLAMSQSESSLADIRFEAEKLTAEFEKLSDTDGQIAGLIEQITQAKEAMVYESACQTLADQITDLKSSLATSGMKDLTLATAQAKQETEALRKEYAALFDKSPELEGMIYQIERLKITQAEQVQATGMQF